MDIYSLRNLTQNGPLLQQIQNVRAIFNSLRISWAAPSTDYAKALENTPLLREIRMERAQINAIRISCATPKPSSANDPFNATFKGKEMHTAPP